MAEMTIDLRELVALAEGLLRAPAAVAKTTDRLLTKWATIGEGIAKRKVSGDVLKHRTGRLTQSISFRVEADGLDRVLRLGVLGGPALVLVYAAAHEYGAAITPKRAKVLTIPLDAAKTPSGVPRFTAPEAKDQFEATFWRRSKAGNLILFGVRNGELVPLFLGLTRVDLPARRFLGQTGDEVFPRLQAELQAAVVETVRTEALGHA